MNKNIDNVAVKADVDDIEAFIYKSQKDYGSFLGISLTNRCPLKCEHCFINASPSDGVDMDTKMVSNIASQLKDLQGTVTKIGITGGEPFLRSQEINIISEAANRMGATVGIVSSGYWARNKLEAERIIGAHKNVKQYDLSTDLYHLRFVPLTALGQYYSVDNPNATQSSFESSTTRI